MVRRDRVEERLRALNISQFEAAKRAGKQEHFIYDFLLGKKKSFKGDGLFRLAQALECSIEYLTGVSDAIGSPPGKPPPPATAAPHSIPFRGIVEAGVFRKAGIPPAAPPGFLTRPLVPDPRYPHSPQSAYLVADDSLAGRGIPRGAFLICVEVSGVDDLASGSVVIVERERKDRDEIEISARELQHFPGRTELRPLDHGPGHESIALRGGKPATPGEQIRVAAFVVSAVIPVS